MHRVGSGFERLRVEQALFSGRSSATVASTCVSVVVFVWCLAKCILTAMPSAVNRDLDELVTGSLIIQTGAIFLLVQDMNRKQSARGVSANSMALLFLGNLCRLTSTVYATMDPYAGPVENYCYLPEVESYGHWLFFPALGMQTAYLILALVRVMRIFETTYQREADRLRFYYFIPLVVVMAYWTQNDCLGDVMDVVYQCEQWFEAVALAPQLWMIAKDNSVQRLTSRFMALVFVAKVVTGLFFVIHYQLKYVDEGDADHWGLYGTFLSHVCTFVISGDYILHYLGAKEVIGQELGEISFSL